MAGHIQEQEELENFKYFWRSWGRWLFGGLVIAALAYLGYIMYQGHKLDKRQEAAGILVKIAEKTEAGADIKETQADLQNLQQNYSDSLAAAQATLMAASLEFDKGNYDVAAGHLNWVLKHQTSAPVQALAVQRLAVVQLQQGKYDEALATLNTSVDSAFESLITETKGDVYAAQGKNKEAVQMYDQALAKLAKDSPNRDAVQFKADQLR
ncbi:YfgM family protein [Neisseria dumasiana]|uniref:Ancillary SecYEG translocon subunit n=1 Tax=Neisseria dumasiana TaxID=1931275 RepID=A0ABX3WPM1_9NEIS|nr:tetratricopeptide repeat protein [Neisseria dumasiana]OSI35818.1 hypothetical protein BV913_04055 [Neisseria dumasiana]UOO85317.1 tetratricopeptide repeat protein [Neisseria dumasiana]